MSEDRNPRLGEQLAETISNKAEAIGGGTNLAIDKVAAKIAQTIGLEPDTEKVKKELENLTLPDSFVPIFKGPLIEERCSLKNADLDQEPNRSRKATLLVGNGSGAHYLLYVRHTILEGIEYYDLVANIGWSLPRGSYVCLISQGETEIHGSYPVLFQSVWRHLDLKTVFVPWQQLLDVTKDSPTNRPGRRLLIRMGMEDLVRPNSANGNQEQAPDLKEFLKQAFEVITLHAFLKEAGGYLKLIAEETNPGEGEDTFCSEVVRQLELFGKINKQVFNDFFDALVAKRKNMEEEILRLKKQYLNS
jgi:hypothetical protein